MNLDALTTGSRMRATVAGDLHHLDLYNLRITDVPLTVSACAHVDMATDLKEYYEVRGMVSDITIHDPKKYYRPEDVVLDVLTRATPPTPLWIAAISTSTWMAGAATTAY